MTTSPGPLVCTGASGFVGSEVVRQAVARGLAVRGVVRAPSPAVAGATFCLADLADLGALRAAFAGAGVVVHAAALAHVFDRRRENSALFEVVNVVGTANVVQAAVTCGVPHVVLISSVAVYGGGSDVDEDAPCRPAGAYAVSKWRAEQQALEIAGAAGVSLTTLRLATVYGEGDRGNVERLIHTLDRGRFAWIGDGRNRKSLIHREDAAAALLLAAAGPPVRPAVYNVAGPPCSMREIVDTLCRALGRRAPPRVVPAWVARPIARAALRLTGGRGPVGALGTAVTKWLADDAYSGARFAAAFGFRTRVGLTEGLTREVGWYRGERARAGRA